MIYRHRTGRAVDKTKLDAMIYNMIYNRIRRLWSIMSPDREHTLWAARREVREGRYRVLYTCAECKEEFPEKEIQVDHIEAIGSRPDTLDGIAEWIKKVFCSYTNLQVLCKPCHKVKTKQDVKRIREAKKNVQQIRRNRKSPKKNTKRHIKLAKIRTAS